MTENKVNTRELLKFTFDVMRKLDNNSIDVDNAKAQANLIKQANNTIRFELDRAVSIAKFGQDLVIRDIEDDYLSDVIS